MEIPWWVALSRWEGKLLRCSLHFLCEDLSFSWPADHSYIGKCYINTVLIISQPQHLSNLSVTLCSQILFISTFACHSFLSCTVLRTDHAALWREHYPLCFKPVHPISHCNGTNQDKPRSPGVLHFTSVPCGGKNCQLIIFSIYLLDMRCNQE